MKQLNAVQKIALERIYRLFDLAEKEFARHPERSKRYVELAGRLGKKNSAAIPTELKKRFCKKCGSYLKKGKNAVWKKAENWVEIKCKQCLFTAKRRL